MEEFRQMLYPLGYVSSLVFGGRFLIQWVRSEINKRSMVTPSFWKISLLGNVLLLLHSIVQVQFHVACIQSLMAVISWRNINLNQPHEKQVSYQQVILMMVASFSMVILLFFLQCGFSVETWFRSPLNQWNIFKSAVHPLWHAVGFFGLSLFSSRFIFQWLNAEKYKTPHLTSTFWWFSLIGGICNLIYFTRILDPVNILGNALGIIPYMRNLMLERSYPKG